MRSLYRLRHDLVMVGRATARPLPDVLAPRLSPKLLGVRDAGSDLLRAMAEALRTRQAAPSLERLENALRDYVAEMDAVWKETQTLAAEDAGRIFVLRFALDQMIQDCRDLADRINELAGTEQGRRIIITKGPRSRPAAATPIAPNPSAAEAEGTMRILLINPGHPSIGSRIPDDHLPPLGLLSVGGPLIDAGHDVRLLDAEFGPMPLGDIVAEAAALRAGRGAGRPFRLDLRPSRRRSRSPVRIRQRLPDVQDRLRRRVPDLSLARGAGGGAADRRHRARRGRGDGAQADARRSKPAARSMDVARHRLSRWAAGRSRRCRARRSATSTPTASAGS